MVNTQLDAIEVSPIYLPYNRIIAELSDEPRLIRGLNAWNTRGGKMSKRPGTIEVAAATSTLRPDRIWIYETRETPAKVYLLGTFFDSGTGTWALYYNRPATSTGWVLAGSIRSLDASTAPQEGVVSNGLFYVKSFPSGASSDKYGTAIFDGTGGSPVVRFWGLPAPTVPARISGRVTRLSATIDSSTTTINVVANFSPAVTPNFTIQVDFEQMLVTSVGGGTNWTVTRGINGTTATAHDDDTTVLYRDWAASDHQVDVNFGWAYAYAYESVTKHVSNRSPLETNPDLLPSITGPFFDLVPKVTVQGHADTTNIPFIRVYRTTDGGGTFQFLEKITNTGAGNITYLDDSLGTGSSSTTFNDPLPDNLLDQRDIAPSLTSNTAPPTVLSPGVIGTDTPARATRVVAFSGRLWYAIGNVLFYSGLEEIIEGIPEESWPSGLTGNFFRYNQDVLNVEATNNALYVFTRQDTHIITGSNRETFNSRPLFEDLGAADNQPRAVTKFGETVAFLSHDYRVVLLRLDQEPETISDPLFTDLIDHLNIGAMQCEIKRWADLDKNWLVISIHNTVDPILSKHWIYDLNLSREQRKNFWFVPWRIPSVATYSGRIAENQGQRRLCWFIHDPAVPFGRLVRMDPTGRTPTDVTVGTALAAGLSGIDFQVESHLHRLPAGNHVNAVNVPARDPNIYSIIFERTLLPTDDDPQVYFYRDDFWTDPIAAEFIEDPARIELPKSYKEMEAHANFVAKRIAWGLQIPNSGYPVEIQGYSILFHPGGGT